MNRDDVIRIAREAGAHTSSFHGRWVMYAADLEKFAALVAAAAKAEEREACAKVVEHTPFSNWFQSDCAAAIRARSNT